MNIMNNEVGYTVKIHGIVQGIGFRPYIYKKARELDIKGWVSNCDSSVIINAEGMRKKIEQFLIEIVKNPPKLAKIQKVELTEKDIEKYKDFVIRKSITSNIKAKFILPDIATCDQCIEDIFNKNSKRYRYAFTNCTLCGPRYSIIKLLPYDRCNTTMNNFQMCLVCNDEYKNPDTRRFHTQPTCCIECGPQLILTDSKGENIKCLDEIKECARLLNDGKILGIKGIGGFHIICNAFDKEAVLEIRNRKKREHKPLALMMRDIDQVKEYCEVSKREEEILLSNKRPIVLLTKKKGNDICQEVAPGMNKYGVMLPCTPLHHLLFKEELPPLVMTSGNISGCPTEYTNEGALKNISNAVDFFLFNNRDINTPIDDSVVKIVEEKVMISRMGRGYSPYYVDRKIKNNILACGAEGKSTFSFALDGIVYMSQYLGDLKELNAYKEYIKSITNMKNIFGFQPKVIAFDMHPSYMSTLYGKSLNDVEAKLPVQHHHAHMASCMLEHRIVDNAIGIIYDGTGLGLDGNIWGGEFFIGSRRKFKRVAHFKYTKIQGADSANRDIWKIGVSYLKNLKDEDVLRFGLKRIERASGNDISNVLSALDHNLNCYKTSSVGRLFDAVSSILGVRESTSYDGQGAIELECIAEENVEESYTYLIEKKYKTHILDYSFMLKDILNDIQKEVNISKISARFHNTIVNMTVEMACTIREEFKIDKVILSGGVFENVYLLKNIYKCLVNKGFQVFFNENIPINDSGISFGQVAVANEILNEKGI